MNARPVHLDELIPDPASPGIEESRPSLGSLIIENFARLLVVALGIGLGTIIAFIAAFCVGWIEFNLGMC
jgi:hypothetical protein